MELLTLRQAAELAGEDISPAALRQACKRGTLEGRRLGRDWVTTQAAVERYLAQRPEWAMRGAALGGRKRRAG